MASPERALERVLVAQVLDAAMFSRTCSTGCLAVVADREGLASSAVRTFAIAWRWTSSTRLMADAVA